MRKLVTLLLALLVYATSAIAATNGVYVVEETGNAVVSFPLTGTGNIAPTTNLTGGSTGLTLPVGICIIGAYMWITDFTNNSISRFNQTDTGNTAPGVVISGGNTTLTHPGACAFDSSGNMWIPQGAQGTGNVIEFSAAQLVAGGNIVPNSSFNYAAGFSAPDSIAFDASSNFFIGQFGNPSCTSNNCFVYRFPAGSSGASVPTYTWSYYASLGQIPGIAIDGHPYLYIADQDGAQVGVYHNTATSSSSTPDVVITGANPNFSGIGGIAVDVNGGLAVTNNADGSVKVFYAGASGNAIPNQKIVGGSTTLGANLGGVAVIGTFAIPSTNMIDPFP